jgi:multimeric flavodoxin WrbA
MSRVLAINGSYRDDGITDQAVDALAKALSNAGAEVEVILLRDHPIEFCLNCRECTQLPGEAPGKCVQQDGMQALIERIESADAFILASPTNFGSVTALFKRFMERLIVYGYWPWHMNSPQLRKAGVARKKALLVSSCAAPGILGRWFYSTHKQLRTTAQLIGADTIGTLFTGLVGKQAQPVLTRPMQAKITSLSQKLL